MFVRRTEKRPTACADENFGVLCQGNGRFVEYSYDLLDRVIEESYYNSSNICTRSFTYVYNPVAGTLTINLNCIDKSPVDHGVMNKTEYALLEQGVEAKKTASENDIEIDANDVKMHADVDAGKGDLEEWIYDALEERLRLDGREGEIGGLDAVAKEVADECGNSLDGFKGSLTVKISDDGEGIKSFEYDGKTHR